MEKIDFLIKAAHHYLANKNIDEKLLKEFDKDVHWSNTNIIPWEPFENCSLDNIFESISDLADDFERIYKKGLEDEIQRDIVGKQEESQQAMRFNEGKPQYSLVDLSSLEPCARVLEFGAEKYARNNWKKGMPMAKIIDSMLRHISALQKGEMLDPESGLSHIGHIQCNALFLGGPNVENDLTEE